MVKGFCLFMSLVFVQIVSGQLLINLHDGLLDWPEHLNKEVIRRNGISSVAIESMVKKDGHPIEKLLDKSVYFFDQNSGLITEAMTITTLFGSGDTSNTLCIYSDNQLIERSTVARGRKLVDRYSYEKDYCTSHDHLAVTFESPPDTVWLNSERFTHKQLNDSTHVTHAFNNYDRCFSQAEFQYNSLGYLLRKIDRLIMTNKQTTFTYIYNDHGNLDSVQEKNNHDDNESKWHYNYDVSGNVISMTEISSSSSKRSYEFIYGTNGLPEALLRHAPEAEEILIFKFQYEMVD
jgi:hypothetical protein